VVDDEPFHLAVLEDALTADDHVVSLAADGEDAWAMMQTGRYDLILLDRMMPRLDGIGLLKRAKADPEWADVPVIMQTAASSPDEICEGFAAGAYYYLTKPFAPEVLKALVATIIAEALVRQSLREVGDKLSIAISLLNEGEFHFRTLIEARALSAALAQVCVESTAAGIGLLELLLNAVEHGNLSITYAEKSAMLQNGTWEAEIERRLASAPWRERGAKVSIRRTDSEIEFAIVDEGNGFDWARYLEFDPDRVFDLHGRGIAMAKSFAFTFLEYRGTGNTVIARAKFRQKIQSHP